MTPILASHTNADFITLALIAVTAVNLGLAWIVIRAARQQENRVFALLATSVALWTLTNALFRTAHTVEVATLWAQASYLSALSTSAAFLHFSWIYPLPTHGRAQPEQVTAKRLTWLVAALLGASVFVSGWVIRGIELDAGRILTGIGIIPIALFIVGTLGTGFLTFYQHQIRLRHKARAQARYVLFGSFLTAIWGLSFNLALPLLNDYRFVWIGPLSSLFFVGFSGYSIIAHHLFDVRLLIRRTLVYTVLLSLMAGGFAVSEKALEYLLRPLLGSGEGLTSELFAALIIGFAVDPIKRQLHHLATKALFRDESPEGIGDNE